MFSELGLRPEILRAIEERGYKEPTPIQQLAIPFVLMGRDVLGCAQTGTGKTAGFCLPMLEILSNGRAKARMPRSIILEPTRELAAQVAESFDIYGKHIGLTVALLTGGTGMDEQIRKLERGVDVLIATPGRMIDLFDRGNVMLHDIKIFVIDEADRMLDMGFIPDIEKIAGLLPKIRQTLFFSATMPTEIRKLADKFLMNPKEISVSPPATTSANVEQFIIRVDGRRKREALRGLLRSQDVKNAFIFCNRKKDIGVLTSSLVRHGFAAIALHGDMPQTKRNESLEAFKNGQGKFLICSDVAARGLDIKGVDAVFNFDTPFNAEDYVHRIGRTGRAGLAGKSYTFVTPDDAKQLDNIQQLIRREIPEMKLEGVDVAPAPEAPIHEHRYESRPPRRHEKPRRDESAPRDSSPRHAYKGPRPSQQNHKSNEKLPDVVGFGDDMPKFLRSGPARPESPAGKQSA